MKRFLALLLLVVTPAFAQEYTPGPYIQPPLPSAETENLIYTTLNPPPPGTQFTWTGFINSNTSGGGLSGGNIPAYNGQTGTFIFGYFQGTVDYNLFFSNEFPPNGTQIDSFKYSWEYFNQEFSRGSLSANIRFYDPNNNILEAHNFQLGPTTNGWTLFGGEIGFDSPYDISQIGRIQVSFTGKDDRFWAGYYGPQVRALDLSLTYSTAPIDTNFLFWDKLADEWGLFTLTEPGVVRYGAEGVYLYQEFQPGTYACTNGDWGNDPIGGVFKSCSLGSNEAPVVVVDCAVNPADPTCVIDSLVDNGIVDPVEQAIADATDMTDEETGIDTGSDDGSSDGTEFFEKDEEVFVASEATEQEADLEEILQDETLEEQQETVVAEAAAETVVERASEPVATSVAAIADESKANELADSISKNVLEGALAIAADNTAAASATGAASVTASSDSSSRSTSVASSSSIVAATETSSSEIKVEETKLESNESSVAALDLLETGRLLGRDALAVTMAATEQSASESISQAESVAMTSNETQTITLASDSRIQTVNEEVSLRDNVADKTESESTILVSQKVEDLVEAEVMKDEILLAKEDAVVEQEEVKENKIEEESPAMEQMVASEETSKEETKEEEIKSEEQEVNVAFEETKNEEEQVVEEAPVMVAEVAVETSTQTSTTEIIVEVEEEKNDVVQVAEVQNVEQVDSFFDIMQLEIKPSEEKVDGDLEFVQQVVAASNEQRQEESNNSGFSEEERITIANDPALANAFNVSPNITNLEVAGVLGGKQEEKSDAEKRADEVVAANAKEQEEINKNYMDADQSGIVAAMGADTDVSAYRTAMLNDNNIWYRPEDIYKNIVYKDNVRGAYFLEKGNTDTYKKMVEEQYK